MSRYETGIHEPPFATAQNLGKVLKVPAAYFYCEDDLLAELLVQYERFDSPRRHRVLDLVAELSVQMD